MSLCSWRRFKGFECGYRGPASWCDRTFARCRELDNTERFHGYPTIGAESMPLFTIRNLPEDLHKRFKLISLYEDKTMNEIAIIAIKKYLKELEERHNLNFGDQENAT